MTNSIRQAAAVASLVLLLPLDLGSQGSPSSGASPLGIFSASEDIGTPSTPGRGSTAYDPATGRYVVAGGGENMWGTADHFQFVWKKVSGDVMLAATVEFAASSPAGGAPDPHRKACLLVRQTLDSDSVYADAAVHGDGLTSLQWRDEKAARRAKCNRT